MTGPDRVTLDHYATLGDRTDIPHDRSFASGPMARFASKLGRGAKVLELGCGGGWDAAAMTEQGLDVEATDGSPEQAEIAQRRLGRPVRVMLFHELDAVERYQGVWASATLLHVAREDLVDVLGRVWRALVPGGWLYASFKTGKPEGRDKFGRYFNYPTEEELRDFLAKAGPWKTIDVETNSGFGSDQVLTDWLHCLAQKVR